MRLRGPRRQSLCSILSVRPCHPSRYIAFQLVIVCPAAGLAFLTLLISLFILRRGSIAASRLFSLITAYVGILAAFLTTVVFLIDLIVVAVVRKRVHKDTDGDINLVWGNAVRLFPKTPPSAIFNRSTSFYRSG